MRAFATRHIVDARLLSSESNCHVFPLYHYVSQQDVNGQVAIDIAGIVGRTPNIRATLLSNLSTKFGSGVTAEEVFFYIYGILNAEGYQTEFASLLQDGFPRIPFTVDHSTFREMAIHGKRLAELHLLEATDLRGMSNLSVGFPITGTNVVSRGYPRFDVDSNRVYVNPDQYFDGITQEMWDYEVGSYKPLRKWLEDRVNQSLSDLQHFERFATAIKKVLDELPQVELTWNAVLTGSWFNPL
jgi:predicted helicase